MKAKKENVAEMSKEEIQRIMEQDEKEVDSLLSRFKTANPQGFSSSPVEVEEEAGEEEEVVSLNFGEDGKVTAVEATNASMIMMEDASSFTFSEGVKKAIDESVMVAMDEPRAKYDKLFHDSLVSKAIGSLLKKINKSGDEMMVMINSKHMGAVSSMFGSEVESMVNKRRVELKKAFSGGVVDYSKIPSWAEGYIREYITNAIFGLVELTERD